MDQLSVPIYFLAAVLAQSVLAGKADLRYRMMDRRAALWGAILFSLLALPTLTAAFVQQIRAWDFIGPFPIGKTELDGDPIAAYPGTYPPAPSSESSAPTRASPQRYPSELVPGGYVSWTKVISEMDGMLSITPQQVEWNTLVQTLGSMEVLEWQGWVVGKFDVPRAGAYFVACQFAHTVLVDNITLPADVYGKGLAKFPISLAVGEHMLRVRLRAKVTARLRCEISLASSDTLLLMMQPEHVPDIVLIRRSNEGQLFSEWLSVPVITHTSWLSNIKISVRSQHFAIHPHHENPHFPLAPGQLTPLPLRITLASKGSTKSESGHSSICETNTNGDTRTATLEISITAEDDQEHPVRSSPEWRSVALTCRKFGGESFLFTFIDHDGTVSHAAAVPPAEPCESKGNENASCPVVVSLHGTGVPARNQADSYKFMKKTKKGKKSTEEWIFGVSEAWLLAPTRHGAHNWEGTGMWTAMSALEALEERTVASANRANIGKVIYAGHSMGGHGAWEVATHYPDRALAVVAAAGWIKKEQYGDSNTLWQHDIQESHMDSALKSILAQAVIENEVDLLVSNLRGIPVMARVGAIDRTVPAYETRRMVRLIEQSNQAAITWSSDISTPVNDSAVVVETARSNDESAEVVVKRQMPKTVLSEIPNKEHWWWDSVETNDGGAVNDREIRNFFKKVLASRALPALPEEFTVTTFNPATFEGRGGFRILQLRVPYRRSEIKVRLGNELWQLQTINVRRFELHGVENLINPSHVPLNGIQIDAQLFSQATISQSLHSQAIQFCLRSSGEESSSWSICGAEDAKRIERIGPSYGPARQLTSAPFLIVIGSNLAHMEVALYIANLHYIAADTRVAIVNDKDLDDREASKYNLMLIGGPEDNTWTRKVVHRWSSQTNTTRVQNVRFDSATSGFKIGHCSFAKPGFGLITTFPILDSSLIESSTLACSDSASCSSTSSAAASNHRFGLILAGTDDAGLRRIMQLAAPTIPPMTRAPFSNLVPDFLVVGPELEAKGYGGVLTAGYWGNQWEWRADTSCEFC